MIINSSTLSGLRTNFSALFQSGYDTAPQFADKLCVGVNAPTGIGTYGWLARLPKMRQWVGPRQIQNLSEKAAVIYSADFELTVGVDRNDIERDNLGVYPPMFQMLGQQSRKHADQLVKAALQAGTSSNGFDGVAFFSASHPVGSSTYSNNYTTSALSAANYQTVRSSMMGLLAEDGEPFGVMPDLLIVPPQLEVTARQILFAEMVSDGAGAGITNVLRNSAQLLVIPELANQSTTWYLADTSKAIKGLVLQTTRAPSFVSKDQPTDDNVFFNKQFLYGVDQSEAVGYGLPWLIARSIA